MNCHKEAKRAQKFKPRIYARAFRSAGVLACEFESRLAATTCFGRGAETPREPAGGDACATQSTYVVADGPKFEDDDEDEDDYDSSTAFLKHALTAGRG